MIPRLSFGFFIISESKRLSLKLLSSWISTTDLMELYFWWSFYIKFIYFYYIWLFYYIFLFCKLSFVIGIFLLLVVTILLLLAFTSFYLSLSEEKTDHVCSEGDFMTLSPIVFSSWFIFKIASISVLLLMWLLINFFLLGGGFYMFKVSIFFCCY